MSIDRFTEVEFHHFKAFEKFSVSFKDFNILVGPNNAGKSTILAAFRMLAHGLRRAHSRKADFIHGPQGMTAGHRVDLSQISVADENLFYNYDDDDAAWIRFKLSTGNSLTLYIPEHGSCYLIPDAQGKSCSTPTSFRKNFDCSIGFVPILGPLEQVEVLNEKETARRARFNYLAARNFRNTWYYYPEGFNELADLIRLTWPGMDILPPEVNRTQGSPRLELWCPENRRLREIAWSGFGFQVWCQMLSHVVRWKESSIFLIDEPDIYLHSDLQRQLLGILKSLGPDIVIATHSTEIITEADTDDIVFVDKHKRKGRRLKRPEQLSEIFKALGSSINPIITQIAKTRKVVFTEGDDFQIITKLARRFGFQRIANKSDFAIVKIGGFSPERVKSIKIGIEQTLGVSIHTCAIFDRDYRSDEEIERLKLEFARECDIFIVHKCKEIENYLLQTESIDKAIRAKISSRLECSSEEIEFKINSVDALTVYSESVKAYTFGQRLDASTRYTREQKSSTHAASINEREMQKFEMGWNKFDNKMLWIGGKEAFSFICQYAQINFGVSLSISNIIDAMERNKCPPEVDDFLQKLDSFTLI